MSPPSTTERFSRGWTVLRSLPPVPAFDAELGLHPLYLSVSRLDAIYVKVVLESYECLCVTRTEDPFYGDDRCLIVLLLVSDFVELAREVIAALETRDPIEYPEPGADVLERLRRDLLAELTTTAAASCQRTGE
jgi:hypothetical protein